jgi:hypothetical protein
MSQQAFQKIVDARLSTAGRQYLTAAVDPYHDTDFDVDGYPDTASQRSVVLTANQQITVNTTVTSDVHVVFTPITKAVFFASAAISSGASSIIPSTATPAGTGVPFGLLGTLTAITVNAGSATFPDLGNITTPASVQTLDISNQAVGNHRIIAAGFEVTNTTNDNSVGGMVTVYRAPCVTRTTTGGLNCVVAGSPPNYYPPTGARVLSRPPANIAEAMSLYGTRQWEAKKGCYCVATQNSIQNPFQSLSSGQYLITNAPYNSVGSGSTSGTLFCNGLTYQPIPNAGSNINMAISGNENAIHPYDYVGAYFTGLPVGTSLTINLKVFVEVTPTASNPQLVSLASPSAGFDSDTLELLAQLIRGLPPGVPVGQNALGDWWRSAVSIAKDALPTLGMAVARSNPITSIAADAYMAVRKAKEGKDTSAEVAKLKQQLIALKASRGSTAIVGTEGNREPIAKKKKKKNKK